MKKKTNTSDTKEYKWNYPVSVENMGKMRKVFKKYKVTYNITDYTEVDEEGAISEYAGYVKGKKENIIKFAISTGLVKNKKEAEKEVKKGD